MITRLNTIRTIPDETSVINDDSPGIRMFLLRPRAGRTFLIRNVFFFLIKCSDNTARLMAGASPVANAAPKIPMDSGNINR